MCGCVALTLWAELTAAGCVGAQASHQTPSALPILLFQTLLSQDEMLNDSRFLTPTFEDWRWCSSMTKNHLYLMPAGAARSSWGPWSRKVLPLLCLCHLPRSISCCQCSHTLQVTLLCDVSPHHAVGNRCWERSGTRVQSLESQD